MWTDLIFLLASIRNIKTANCLANGMPKTYSEVHTAVCCIYALSLRVFLRLPVFLIFPF